MRGLLALVRRRFTARPSAAVLPVASAAGLEPLLAAGHCLRAGREERGLSLRQLAMETRVSTAVLEALERGWRERLPEPTYLRTILPLLEQHLELPSGSLAGAQPAHWQPHQGPRRQPLVRRFTPGSIDVFTSWQGTLLYGGLTLLLLYALNLQQQRLAGQQLLNSRSIVALSPAAPVAAAGGILLQSYPDLRPLHRAAAGRGLNQLRQESQPHAAAASPGRLSLELNGAGAVDLRSAGSGAIHLERLSGQLDLPLRPPFTLEIRPATAVGRVEWNGQALRAEGPGRYRSPAAGEASAAARGPRP